MKLLIALITTVTVVGVILYVSLQSKKTSNTNTIDLKFADWITEKPLGLELDVDIYIQVKELRKQVEKSLSFKEGEIILIYRDKLCHRLLDDFHLMDYHVLPNSTIFVDVIKDEMSKRNFEIKFLECSNL